MTTNRSATSRLASVGLLKPRLIWLRPRLGVFDIAGNDAMHMNYATIMCRHKKAPPVGLEPTIFGLEVRRLVH